jgi:hypothetical protein
MLASESRGLMVPINDQAALDRALRCAMGRNWNREAISAWGRARGWHQVAAEALEQMQEMLGRN